MSDDLIKRVRGHVDEVAAAVTAVFRAIHDHPELAYEERFACETITEVLQGFGDVRVARPYDDLPTAFVAEHGDGDLCVTFCAEYDALPGIGHACGHNIIAAAAVGAFLALRAPATELGLRVRLVGTPAEERGGGKVDLLRRGAFEGSHAVMMVHPTNAPTGHVMMPTRASTAYEVEYLGKAAHAAIEPWSAVNAMDAMTLMSAAIGLARQQLEPNQQIHGYIAHAGNASNVVPDHAQSEWMLRAESLESLQRLYRTFERCARAGAVATGAEVRLTRFEHPYGAMTPDRRLAEVFKAVVDETGGAFELESPALSGSTDFSNVSNHYPAIHPMVPVPNTGADMHSAEFATASGTDEAAEVARSSALWLAATAATLAVDDDHRARLIGRDEPGTSRAGEELGEAVEPYRA